MAIAEEPLDAFLYRPIAKLIAAALHPTGMTANQLTVCAAIIGAAGGAAIAIGTRGWIIAAGALLFLFLVLDCADGELARRRGGGSRLGQVLDGLSDYVVAVAAHVGLLILALRVGFPPLPAWAIVVILVACGACKAVHSALFDAAKARFRMGLGRRTAGLESVESIRQELAAATALRERLFLRLYLFYIRAQRTVGAASSAERAPSQAEFLAWTVLGPTTRLTIIVATLLASLADARALAIYPLFALGAANVWLVLLWIRRRLSARLPVPADASESGRP